MTFVDNLFSSILLLLSKNSQNELIKETSLTDDVSDPFERNFNNNNCHFKTSEFDKNHEYSYRVLASPPPLSLGSPDFRLLL
jgi:hypothetical protein